MEYGGEGWRKTHSSAGPPLVPGSEQFTLDKVGPEHMTQGGAAAPGAMRIRDEYFDVSNTFMGASMITAPAEAK